jgi:hypothetical protein
MKMFAFVILAGITSSEVLGQRRVRPDSIQIAFLLDVSSSMDGLIHKAKSQIWRIGSYLSSATKNNKGPLVEFSIMTYGFEDESESPKILIDFNSDLDSVVMGLYDIETNGGNEYCWTTISRALSDLNWSKSENDLKLIVIAGNESFNQEEIDTKQIIQQAKKLGVVINAIYCGSSEAAESGEWRKAADLAKGNYFNISLDDSLNLQETFLDKKLADFNEKLIATYVPFGPQGQKYCSRMLLQDKSARIAGAPFFRERMHYKSSHSFLNPTWDLIDAYGADTTIVENDVIKNDFNLDEAALKEFIEDKKYTRETYREVIRLRYDMIRKYVGDDNADKDLDEGMRKIISTEGRKKGFVFKDSGNE